MNAVADPEKKIKGVRNLKLTKFLFVAYNGGSL